MPADAWLIHKLNRSDSVGCSGFSSSSDRSI